MDTLYAVWDTIPHYKSESVYFLGLMNCGMPSLEVIIASVSFQIVGLSLFVNG